MIFRVYYIQKYMFYDFRWAATRNGISQYVIPIEMSSLVFYTDQKISDDYSGLILAMKSSIE